MLKAIKKTVRRLVRPPRGPSAAAALRAGVTLTELMIAVTVLTIGVIGGMGSFKYINRAMTQARIKTIATNLAQERMEVLRNKSYFQLLVTTATADSAGYSPNFPYDTSSYPPQTITLWGMPALTRVVNVDYVGVSGTDMVDLPYTSNDPGMKKITVTVMWTNDTGAPRKVQIASFYENPTARVLSSGFYGNITDADDGSPLPNVLVQVQDSPNWRAYTNDSGDYSFHVSPGSYTLVCSTRVYYSSMTARLPALTGTFKEHDFSLTKVPVGRVSGMAYIRDRLLISQVVGSSLNASGQSQEWVEVYNPTTWTWTMANGLGADAANRVGWIAHTEAGEADILPSFDYRTLSVGPGAYYLFANTGTVVTSWGSLAADAVYSVDGDFNNIDDMIKTGSPSPAGFVTVKYASDISDPSTIFEMDLVGWDATANGNGTKKTAPRYEGQAIVQSIGLQVGEEYTRRSAPGGVISGQGRCYDRDNNEDDFMDTGSLVNRPHNSLDIEPCVTGRPAAGAVVTATDGLSKSAQASSTGYFLLNGLATNIVQGAVNTWTVNISSAPSSFVLLASSEGVTVTANQNKNLGTIALSTSTEGGIAAGYVFGSGPDQNRPLGNPSILVGAGGATANTDTQGFYMLFVPTGTVTITANYGNNNGSYLSSDIQVTVEQGEIASVDPFHLGQGGYISGYVTSGTGALPDVIVQATNGGPVYTGTSDSTGHFYIYASTSNLAYEVTPVLDALQSYTSVPTDPLSVSLTVPGASVEAGTITVAGALGTIEGVLKHGSSVITTGVLVVASTATINDPLPPIRADTSPTEEVYYSVSSQADGTYSMDVRGSATETYNISAFYPVVDANTGAVSYTVRSAAGVSVTAGQTTTRDFSW